MLKNDISYYNWVGLYVVDKEKSNELVLVSFEGEPTSHVRIPFGKGVCGQVALIKKTLAVQDVTKEANYIPCSSRVKSEIVIPIFRNEELIGELDVDSHIASPFTVDDEKFLTEIAEVISGFL